MVLYSYRWYIVGIYDKFWTYKLKGKVLEGEGGMHVPTDEISIIPVWWPSLKHLPSI
jgi:hypothetical protein